MPEPGSDPFSPENTRVLIIDDEASMREACQEVLRREGFQTTIAGEGGEGLRLVRELKPHVIFVDLKMPGMAGLELLDHIGLAAPGAVLVVVTAYATVSLAMAALRHGAFDFLAKPFTPDELRLMASRAQEQRRLLERGQRLQNERDQAKRRFMELVTGEVNEPLRAALAELRGLCEKLADRPAALAQAQNASERLRRLLEMVQHLSA
ncbi:response regulator receiver protein [Desulfarculus baarsii DSM 2075]|uniref:Response regulator receiver protein n=1 Tax=Desulfarculus baarsii (strain ATCC 33931 / DSM 2075 / LMG 7858 / VKM B-1802 / 2st14) TaxID=644282 RepID=E1QF80_DESB2|nr:response regulator [Desulfarculus baarsii]ADK84216.1 response regulator receiver protein [Desulfarculus baarsii DSM 2075]